MNDELPAPKPRRATGVTPKVSLKTALDDLEVEPKVEAATPDEMGMDENLDLAAMDEDFEDELVQEKSKGKLEIRERFQND